ncbi:MAG: hypothetical protein K2Y42_07090 [Hyphomicrobium sp.]|jgi:hypothetical protein|uniref:hypothetical protein n=1 Tax=Hyphomicrobium sp. TaxID=82 RepID=UPI0025BD386A|nr:hypothetical protein [Hyphomicrobium sp.]MBX9862503.1 hypothetical protein [Hyphomicrobium sp.]
MNRLLMIAPLAVGLVATSAHAEVNDAVRNACRADYHKHCENLEVGSPELRACMKSKATELSQGCLQALVDNKEVTEADVDAYIKEMDAKRKAAQ